MVCHGMSWYVMVCHLVHEIQEYSGCLFLRWSHSGVACHCWPWFLPFSSCGGDGRVPCGISIIARLSGSLHGKGPSLSLAEFRQYFVMFCNILSCSVHIVFSSNLSLKHWLGFAVDFCHISPRSAFFVAAVQESPLPKETSTPSGMQWPGSALSSAEALSARSVDAIQLMHVDVCWCV